MGQSNPSPLYERVAAATSGGPSGDGASAARAAFRAFTGIPPRKDNGHNRFAVQRVVQMVQVGGPPGQDEAVPPAAQSVYDVGKDLLRPRHVGGEITIDGADPPGADESASPA